VLKVEDCAARRRTEGARGHHRINRSRRRRTLHDWNRMEGLRGLVAVRDTSRGSLRWPEPKRASRKARRRSGTEFGWRSDHFCFFRTNPTRFYACSG